MLAAEMAAAETAVSDNALCRVLAVLEVASNLLRCSSSDGQRHMDSAFAGDIVSGEGFRG